MNNNIALTRWKFLAVLICMFWSSWSLASDQDEMKHKLLACAGCHEYQYNGRQSYAPSLTGKPVQYLYQQLLNYREGRRLHGTMEKMLAYLSDDYLHEISSYYAELATDNLRQEHKSIEQSSAQAVIGKTIALTGSSGPACVACHGNDLRGDGVAIPSLRDLSGTYIAAQLGAWRTNARHAREPDCMKEVANHLTGEEANAVAQWIANSFEKAAAPLPIDSELPLPCGAIK